jgi:hypothetical protein
MKRRSNTKKKAPPFHVSEQVLQQHQHQQQHQQQQQQQLEILLGTGRQRPTTEESALAKKNHRLAKELVRRIVSCIDLVVVLVLIL